MKYYIGSMAYGHEDIRHFGILGMKWGVRRYQNPDGTLTEEGKQRYSRATTSNYEYHYNVDKAVKSKRVQKEVKRITDTDSRLDGLRTAASQLSSSGKQFENAYKSATNKFYKENPYWSGDGTEEHWALEERYPEYKDAYKKYEQSCITYVEQVLKASQSGAFDWILRDVTDFDTQHDNVIKDGKAEVLSYILGGRYGNDAEDTATTPEYMDWYSRGAGYKYDYGSLSRKKN